MRTDELALLHGNRSPAIPLDSVTNDEIEAAVKEKIETTRAYMHRTIEQAWELGLWLAVKRKRTKHRDWGPWVESHGMSMSMAWRYMRLTEHNWQNLGQFGSVSAAVDALPPSRGEARPSQDAKPGQTMTVKGEVVKQPEKSMTKSEQRLLEEQKLKSQAREAEERAAKAEQERDEAVQKAKHLEQGEKVGEGFHQGTSVIEQLQGKNRQMLAALSRKDDEITALKRENTGLRQRIKEQAQQIENFMREDQPPPTQPPAGAATDNGSAAPEEDLAEYDIDEFNDEAY